MVQVRKNHFDNQMASKKLPQDNPTLAKSGKAAKSFEQNPQGGKFEQQTDRSTWQDSQGKVGPSKTQSGESDGPPSIVESKGAQAGVAKHPHWRADASNRGRMDALTGKAHKHTKVNPDDSGN